jgi:homoserine kinase
MKSRSVLVKVPATVGNFAGAMDCAALTLDAMFNVKVTPRLDGRVGIRYFGENGDRVPRDRSNLVVRAMESALHLKGLEFTGADFEIYSSVPVGVGMGSSTAALLAGLIAADRLYALHLDEKTLFELAQIYETRIDNLQAAWYGGFVACTGEGPAPVLRRTFVPGDFVLSVVTPEASPYAPASDDRNTAESSGKDASLDLDRARALADLFARPGRGPAAGLESAQPFSCRKVVPGLEDALKVREEGVVGVFICGSGPAVGILSQQDADRAIRAVRQCFLENGLGSTYGMFRPTNVGAQELNAVRPRITFPALRVAETNASGQVL